LVLHLQHQIVTHGRWSTAIFAVGPTGILPVDFIGKPRGKNASPLSLPNYLATLAGGLMFRYIL
jgi:hypothetical protein